MSSALISIIDFLVLFTALVFLTKAADIVVHSISHLSRSNKIEPFALAGVLSAAATNLPELFVSVSGAVMGDTNLVLGVVLGSNIANITLIAGMVAVIGGSLGVVGDFIKKDVLKAFLVLLFPLFLLIDGNLSFFDGLLLVAAFILYHLTVFQKKREYGYYRENTPFWSTRKWLSRFNRTYKNKQLLWLIFGLVMLLFSADVAVEVATRIAVDLRLPLIIIGLFFIAVGTSLPELVFEARAARLGQTGMVFGNLLGSLVANATLILGLTALIHPVSIAGREQYVFQALIMFFLSFLLLWFFIKTKLKLQRWEGGVLVIAYLLFLFLQLRLVY
ncbi:MAG: calcium/sodium antiporter [Patescibacteria group bacterium]|jgi:cation:H+ antiporter